MIRVVKCKIRPTAEERESLLKTLVAFSDACNAALEVARVNTIRRAYDIHHHCYHQIKSDTGLTANHVVRAIARVAGSFSKGRKPPKAFRPTSLDLDKDLFRYDPIFETVSISSIDGRLKKVKLRLGEYQRRMLVGQKPKAGTLTYEKRKDRFYIHFCVETETPEAGGQAPLGVDRGINRIVATSDGFLKSGKSLNFLRRRIQRTVTSLQSKKAKGTNHGKRNNCYRVLKRLSGKTQRLQKNTNHVLSKRIVERARHTNSYIVLENLEGIKKRCKGKRLRKILGGWAFFQFQTFVEYKAALVGVAVKYVDPAYTSKTCPECLNFGTRQKHKFSCSQCGYVGDSDLVGALNIARLGLPVNQPEVVC